MCESQPVDNAGHVDVGEKDVDRSWLRRQQRERLLAVGRLKDCEPGLGENFAGNHSDDRLVLNQEHDALRGWSLVDIRHSVSSCSWLKRSSSSERTPEKLIARAKSRPLQTHVIGFAACGSWAAQAATNQSSEAEAS